MAPRPSQEGSWGVLGPSWEDFGPLLGTLGPSWDGLGGFWAVLRGSWAALGGFWALYGFDQLIQFMDSILLFDSLIRNSDSIH